MDATRDVVTGVIREALRERGLTSAVLLRPGSPGHQLLADWLTEAGFRRAEIGTRPDGDAPTFRAADRAPAERAEVVLDPAPKEVVLLDGPLPGADVLPLGDVWGSRVEARDPAVPLRPLERALSAAFERSEGLGALTSHLSDEDAAAVRRRLLRVAPLLRAPVVPKLTEWTPGIDPGP
jgi:hypothetical protein